MLRIEKQNAILSWDKKDAKLEQSGNARMTLDIETSKPQISIRTRSPQILIDQTEPFAEAGIKSVRAFMQDSVAFARQKLSQGISRIVSDGNEWLDIHTGVDPIPDQAIYNAFEMFDKEFVFAMIPQSRPQIDVNLGEVDIQLNKGEVINRTLPQKIDMQYTPWQMAFFMKQYHSIHFTYENSKLDITL